MSFDWLKDPISEDAPCGPDLEATDDAPFVDYYFEAESRMPERYFTPGIKGPDDDFMPGVSFDPATIKHATEKKTITELLKKSRDLRLVSLLARMMVLAARLQDFADAVTAMADLLETFPDRVHPTDQSDRRSAIDELGNNAIVAIPLQHINIAGAAEVTYRKYLAATGQSEPRQGEVGLNPGTMTSELSSPGNSKAVEAAHAALNQTASALKRIKSACMRLDNPFTPTLGPTEKAIADIQRLIAESRTDLKPWSDDSPSAEAEDDEVGSHASNTSPIDEADSAKPAATAPTPAAEPLAGAIPNRAAALQALNTIEAFMATHEPSSPSLLLITQARLLVGKPLVEAIETLLPEHANKTKITLGEGTGFVLYMDRLKMLAGEAGGRAQSLESEDAGAPPEITSRVNIAPVLTSIESFFRSKEPASPIPVLLFRARTLLDKDFTSTVSDLIPPANNE
ncbi:type VI secretion system protein ImpA [Cognatiyoonia koreensis]|uniref:Type VI secretion system protein ImpA n=1 Tax=Cognatiyoonia koreensis TaxID=364200 RepID=A0A1I0RGI1_9RHOB|nr:type VI secretion system ImpA family N-terminal domain-containing protein [Cognatiyoonia koreensis]SEW39967.1 type VI secretion system protein ImpA [Cognatiyoonia koreensis]